MKIAALSLALAVLLSCGAALAAGEKCPPANDAPCIPILSDKERADLVAAANGGAREAQFTLGVVHDTGDGVPPDAKEALRWYRAAADQGSARAQYQLGMIFAKGRTGIPMDKDEAAHWFAQSAQAGFAPAQYAMGLADMRHLSAEGTPAEGIALLAQAAAQGHIHAQGALCESYFSGTGVARDYGETYFWCGVLAHGHDASTAFWHDAVQKNLTAAQRAAGDTRLKTWFADHPAASLMPVPATETGNFFTRP